MTTRDMNIAAITKVLLAFQEKNEPKEVGALAEEIADALPNYPELMASAFKKILPEELLDLIVLYALAASCDVFSAT